MKSKILSMLLSVAIAFGLWFYVVTVVSTESTEPISGIPVVLEGEAVLEERGLMIVSDKNVTASLKLTGSRSDHKKINKSNITLKVDLTKIYEPGTHYLSYNNPTFPGDVANGAFTVEERYPETIAVTVEKRLYREIPVEIGYNGAVPEGFLADMGNAVLDYAYVNVNGPASVVELIDHARIDVNLEDQTESISGNYRYTLCDVEGNPVDVAMVTTDVAEIHLDVKIQRYEEITLLVNAIYGGGATETNTKIQINPKSIRVSGSEALLSDLTTEMVLGTINLADIPEKTQITFPIKLPDGVTNLSGVTEATVDISFTGLVTKEYTTGNIKVINVPEGMEYDLMNDVMKVILRGTNSQMNTLDPENIEVTVDLTGKELGASTIKATVIVKGDGYETVGPVGTHSVSVTLREEEDS